MVIKADGTKWACQSCLKGHRVSGCTHTDRDLTLVPKKGRPVTQCQHCRSERKKRSAHVSCVCAGVEKPHHPKEKCIHLREADERLKASLPVEHGSEHNAAHLAAVAEEQGCCCPHGGKCTCAFLKKEIEDDGTVTPPHGPAVKPRLEPTRSEGSITVFQNGHHKPVHRKNHLAHEAGMPYKMPMPRANTDLTMAAKARRSVDSLALDSNMPSTPSAFMPQTSAPFNSERRMSRSEETSPKPFGMGAECAGLGNAKLTNIDFSNLEPLQTDQAMQCTTNDPYGFLPLEPMSAMTDNTYDPWSALPSGESIGMPNNNPFTVWPTNPDVSGIAQPALTAASSGTQSEIDDVPPMDDMYSFGMPSIQEDASNFDFDALVGAGSPQSNRRSLPANFFKSTPDASEWPFNTDASMMTSPKVVDATQAFAFDDMWEGSNLPPVTDMPHGLPTSGRPTSRSVGPAQAPNDTVIQQLFPDMDLGGDYFDSTSAEPAFSTTTNKRAAPAGAAPMDFGPMNEEVDFTAQTWSDGSMTVPNDNMGPSFDELDQDFSNPDFTGNWTQ